MPGSIYEPETVSDGTNHTRIPRSQAPIHWYNRRKSPGTRGSPEPKTRGVEWVKAFASRGLQGSERNDKDSSAFKLALLALKMAVTE